MTTGGQVVVEGVTGRWARWMLYSWATLVLIAVAGMVVNSARQEGPVGVAAALGAVLAYSPFFVIALLALVAPAALGTFLWEARWGRHRLHANGDAIGAVVAAASASLVLLFHGPTRPYVVILVVPIFMAMRALSRARSDADRDAAVVARVIMLLAAAQAIVIALRALIQPVSAQILVAVPVLLAALAVAISRESLRGGSWRDALALRRPMSQLAWLVALLPAATILFAQLLSPGGFTYDATLPALALVVVLTEIAFRGFAYRRLRRAGARFLVAAIMSGIIALSPYIIYIREDNQLLTFAGVLAQSIWLAWLVERWQSVWIAIVSSLLLMVGLDGLAMLTDETRLWLSLALRLWIIGISVALTQTLQRRRPALVPG